MILAVLGHPHMPEILQTVEKASRFQPTPYSPELLFEDICLGPQYGPQGFLEMPGPLTVHIGYKVGI